jgi:hypothetical protein
MNGPQRNHCASVLLIVASLFWWHRWVPALLLVGVVSWAILHGRLEGTLGEGLDRLWRRAWPPGTIALIPLLLGGTLAYWISDEAITPKVLPIALNIVALSIMLFGSRLTWFAYPRRLRTAATREPVGSVARVASSYETPG